MRNNLWDDPRVSRICDITGQTEATIIGALYWLWSSADDHSEDGVMPGLSLSGIDRKTGINGLGDSLVAIGWLMDHPEGVRIVREDKHGNELFILGCYPVRPPTHIWAALRTAVFERDDYTCQYCHSRGGKLECDHVVPVSRGGLHDMSNLKTACFSCNRSKNTKLISEWMGA